MWKHNSTVLSDNWVKEYIKEEIKLLIESNENEDTDIKVFGTQLRQY